MAGLWVTAGLRLSGTRVKTRLISCLEVAYTTIHQYILLLFRQDECLEVVFLGSLNPTMHVDNVLTWTLFIEFFLTIRWNFMNSSVYFQNSFTSCFSL